LASADVLTRVRPALFFEYDPYYGARPEIFDYLREFGYERMVVYENTGLLARAGPVDSWPHDEYAGEGGARYADVFTYHREDARAPLVERSERGM
jgi:hypothetical protein